MEGETTTDFITRVNIAAAPCELGALKDDMIVQIVINGLRKEDLHRKFLLEERVDLQTICTKCEQVELAERTSRAIGSTEIGVVSRDNVVEPVVAAMSSSNFRGTTRGRRQQEWQSRPLNRGSPRKEYYEKEKRPQEEQWNYIARAMECYICKRKGHKLSECYSKGGPRKPDNRGNNQKETEHEFRCYNCGCGHKASVCCSKPRKREFTPRTNPGIREIGTTSDREPEVDYDYAGEVLYHD